VKLYKLTDENGQTHGGTQWGEGVEHTAPGIGELCGAGWIHAYVGSEADPGAGALLAVLLNPIHANFSPMRLWEAEGEVGKVDYGLKVGCTRLRTLRQIPVPAVSTAQRIRFGILCALEVCPHGGWGIKFRLWATHWLDGTERAAEAAAARAAAAAAWEAAEEAAWAAAEAAAAARAAAEAARAAAAAARAAEAGIQFNLAAIVRRTMLVPPGPGPG